MTNTPPLAYSIKEACAASSLGRTSIYAHISAGRLRSVRLGRRTLIPADSLHALLEGKEASQCPPSTASACSSPTFGPVPGSSVGVCRGVIPIV